jgi:hypothetical protein
MRCYISVGFKADEVSTIMQSLIQKGFLIETEDKIQVTDKWRGKIKQYEKEFETFWVETTPEGKIRTAWAGSKPEAQKLFVKLRKTYSFEYLMGQRNDYFKYLEYQQKIRKFDQQRMMCTVFLNPAKERFAEKWASYIPETKPEEPAQKPMTQEELGKQYE